MRNDGVQDTSVFRSTLDECHFLKCFPYDTVHSVHRTTSKISETVGQDLHSTFCVTSSLHRSQGFGLAAHIMELCVQWMVCGWQVDIGLVKLRFETFFNARADLEDWARFGRGFRGLYSEPCGLEVFLVCWVVASECLCLSVGSLKQTQRNRAARIRNCNKSRQLNSSGLWCTFCSF